MRLRRAYSLPFCRFLSRLLLDAFPDNEAAFAPDNLVRLYGRVKPDFIRVSADEVTYPSHIALRYRLEAGLDRRRSRGE